MAAPRVQFRYSLTPLDDRIVTALIDRHTIEGGFAGVFRFVSAIPLLHGGKIPPGELAIIKALAESVRNLQTRSKLIGKKAAAIRHGTTWVEPETVQRFAKVAKRWHLGKSEAIRFCLRVQASIDSLLDS
jgi:hypothetical protein